VVLTGHVRWLTASRNPSKICPCDGGSARTHLVESVRRLGPQPARASPCPEARLPTPTSAAVKMRVFGFIDWLQAGRGQVLEFDHHTGHGMPSPITEGAAVGRSLPYALHQTVSIPLRCWCARTPPRTSRTDDSTSGLRLNVGHPLCTGLWEMLLVPGDGSISSVNLMFDLGEAVSFAGIAKENRLDP
jgi:hypothetical protein